MGKVEEVGRITFRFLLDALRKMTPFLVCIFGMSAPVVLSPDHVLGGVFIAGIAFAWALDMAETRAAADARSDTAARFIAFMTTGNDRDINITVYRQTAALSEDKEQG